MSTATATASSTDALQQIGELHQRAAELKSSYETEYASIMQQISDVATGEHVGGSAPTPPPRQTATATATAAVPKRGRRPGTTASVPKKAVAVSPDQRNYSNDMSLKEAVFDVLDRENWNGILTLEDGTVSLGAGEIKKVILAEKKWVSSAADITSQLQGALGTLKKAGLVVREGGRYFIPEGVEYPKS